MFGVTPYARGLVRCNHMLGGATLLRRCRTNDHRPAAGAFERHTILSEGLVDQAHDRWASECGRALHENPTRLAGPLQQFRRVRQFLTLIEVQLYAVRARADCKNSVVPVLI